MNVRRSSVLGMLALSGVIPSALSQTTPPPPAAGAAAPLALPAASAAAAPAAAAAQPTLWGFLGISKAGCAACKDKICNSQLGVLLNGMAAPASGLTGGIIPPFCPPVPSASELAAINQMPADQRGPQEVAALIKADEAAAKARVAAVEYLGTVDCSYWPEAKAILISSLREDRNECVRFAAARVLASGCCCDKQTIEALTIAVTGSTKDDNPAEKSQRVRAAAQIALQSCLARYDEPFEPVVPESDPITPETPTPPETPGEEPTPLEAPSASIPLTVGSNAKSSPAGDGLHLTAYYRQIQRKPAAQIVSEAREALQFSAMHPSQNMTTGRRSVYHAFARATEPAAMPPASSAVAAPSAYPNTISRVAPIQPARDPAVMNTSATRTAPSQSTGSRGILGIFSDARKRSTR